MEIKSGHLIKLEKLYRLGRPKTKTEQGEQAGGISGCLHAFDVGAR